MNDSSYSCYTGFKTSGYMAYSVDATGLLLQTYHNRTTTFTGLPAAVAGGMGDFGKDSGGVALLSDGSMVLTLDVRLFDRRRCRVPMRQGA